MCFAHTCKTVRVLNKCPKTNPPLTPDQPPFKGGRYVKSDDGNGGRQCPGGAEKIKAKTCYYFPPQICFDLVGGPGLQFIRCMQFTETGLSMMQ